MDREDWGSLAAFAIVAEERSFTRAAARLGVSPSALSHTIRRLEERLRMQLLARSTRSVSTTQAGERLLARLGPAIEEISNAVEDLGRLLDRQPSGPWVPFAVSSYVEVADPPEADLLRDTWLVGPVFSTVLWPVTKLFEYKVTGTLGEPKAEPVYLIPKVLLLPFQFPFHPLRTLRGLFPEDLGSSRTNSPPLHSPKEN